MSEHFIIGRVPTGSSISSPASWTSETITINAIDTSPEEPPAPIAIGDLLLVFCSTEGGSDTATSLACAPVAIPGINTVENGGLHPDGSTAGPTPSTNPNPIIVSNTLFNSAGTDTSNDTDGDGIPTSRWIDLGYTAGGYTQGGQPGRNSGGIWAKVVTARDLDPAALESTDDQVIVTVTLDRSRAAECRMMVVSNASTTSEDLMTMINIARTAMANTRSNSSSDGPGGTNGSVYSRPEWLGPNAPAQSPVSGATTAPQNVLFKGTATVGPSDQVIFTAFSDPDDATISRADTSIDLSTFTAGRICSVSGSDDNNGLYVVTGTPTAASISIIPVGGTVPVTAEPASASVTIKSTGYSSDALSDDFLSLFFAVVPPAGAPVPTTDPDAPFDDGSVRPPATQATSYGALNTWEDGTGPNGIGFYPAGDSLVDKSHGRSWWWDRQESFSTFDGLWNGTTGGITDDDRFAWVMTTNNLWAFNSHLLLIKQAIAGGTANTRTFTDAASATDILETAKGTANTVSFTDAASATDILEVDEVDAYTRSFTDASSATDILNVAKSVFNEITFTDASSVTDILSTAEVEANVRTFTDLVAPIEDILTASEFASTFITFIDTVSGTDILEADEIDANVRIFTDATSTSDTLSVSKSSSVTLTDSSTAGDDLVATTFGAFTFIETDSSTASDTLLAFKNVPRAEVVASVSMTAVGSVAQSNVTSLTFTPTISLSPGDQLVLIIGGVGGTSSTTGPTFDAAFSYSGFTTYYDDSGNDQEVAYEVLSPGEGIWQGTISWMGVRTVASSGEPSDYSFTATFQRDAGEDTTDPSATGNIIGGVLLRISNVVPALTGATKNWPIVDSASDVGRSLSTTINGQFMGDSTTEWSSQNSLTFFFAGYNRIYTDYTTESAKTSYQASDLAAGLYTDLYDEALQGSSTTDADDQVLASAYVSYALLKDRSSKLSKIRNSYSTFSPPLPKENRTVRMRQLEIPALVVGANVFTETDSASSSDTLSVTKAAVLTNTDAATASDTLLAVRSGAKVFAETDSATAADTLSATKSVALTFTDATSATDILQVEDTDANTRTFTDAASAADVPTITYTPAGTGEIRTFTDASSGTDVLDIFKGFFVTFIDATSATDVLETSKGTFSAVTFTDASSSTDILQRSKGQVLSFTDSGSVSDIINIETTSFNSLVFIDSASAADSLAKTISLSKTFTDSVSSADVLDATGPTVVQIEVTIPGIGSVFSDLLTEEQALAVIDIWNTALTSLGITAVASTTDGSPQQLLLTNIYPLFRKQFLADHLWNGAKKTKALTTLKDDAGDAVSPPSRWTNAFALPSDVLRVWRLNGLENRPDYVGGFTTNMWEIEVIVSDEGEAEEALTRALCTDESTATIEYVFDVGDKVTLLGPLTQHALGRALAVYVAHNFGKNATEIAQLEALAKEALLAAKGVDGQEGSPQIMSPTSLLGVRYI